MLTSGNYTFSQSHTYTGDIQHEIGSAGYPAGGLAILNTVCAIDTIDNEAYLDGDDLTFTGLTAGIRYGILYISGDNSIPRSNPVIGCIDFGAQSLTATDFVIQWNNEGVITLG